MSQYIIFRDVFFSLSLRWSPKSHSRNFYHSQRNGSRGNRLFHRVPHWYHFFVIIPQPKKKHFINILRITCINNDEKTRNGTTTTAKATSNQISFDYRNMNIKKIHFHKCFDRYLVCHNS